MVRRNRSKFGEDLRSDLSLRAKRGRGAGEIGTPADVEDSDSGGSCGEDLGKCHRVQFGADSLKSKVRRWITYKISPSPLSCATFYTTRGPDSQGLMMKLPVFHRIYGHDF